LRPGRVRDVSPSLVAGHDRSAANAGGTTLGWRVRLPRRLHRPDNVSSNPSSPRRGWAAGRPIREVTMTQTYEFQHVEGGVPIKMWTRGVPVDDKAREQLTRAAQMPFVFKHVAAMPDVHVGIGATVGSVIPTKGAVIPAA